MAQLVTALKEFRDEKESLRERLREAVSENEMLLSANAGNYRNTLLVKLKEENADLKRQVSKQEGIKENSGKPDPKRNLHVILAHMMSLMHISNLASAHRLALTTENTYRNIKTAMDVLTYVDEKLGQDASLGGIAEMPKVLERPHKVRYFSEESLTQPDFGDETLVCIPGEIKAGLNPRHLATVPVEMEECNRPSQEYGAAKYSGSKQKAADQSGYSRNVSDGNSMALNSYASIYNQSQR